MFTKKFSSEAKKIIALFLGWRVILFTVSFLAVRLVPKWGGRFPYEDRVLVPTGLPSWIWSFGNFDGVHYLRIAQDGYAAANTQVFFPLYPILVKILNIFPKNPSLDLSLFVDPTYFYTAFILSNLFFLFALYYFYKLLRLNFDKKITHWSLILLLVFPASFYFGAVYTESLFLLLAVASIYYSRKHNFLLSGVLAGFASATRVLGLMLLPLIALEIYLWAKGRRIELGEKLKALIGISAVPMGTLLYMVYLKVITGSYLYFLTAQAPFGAQRSAERFILLPQVIYRYLKIFSSLPVFSLEYFNASIEFLFALIPLTLLIIFWKKMRLSYWVFTLGVLLAPTLTGTFSSMPRYALMGFLLLPLIAKNKKLRAPLVFVFILLGVILIGLFTRGYWVA
jgi:Gpi18-like mannosyltransferase